ncbi:MAG: hypothetical protein MMC33_007485 [Icmadophila ericetorum]|nr:hypothetical protein [Icmadophila ericetorum]
MASPLPRPALAPPSGETADFGEPNPLWRWNVLTQCVCTAVPGICFILRTYVRAWIKRSWILEDYLCCLAFVGLVTYSVLLSVLVSMHGGDHEWDVTSPEFGTILYYLNVIQITYSPAAAITKCTILLLYLRVFTPRRWDKLSIIIKTFILIVCLFYVALSLSKICQCVPRERIWNKTVPGKCLDLPVLLDSSGLFNIISDVCILLVPLKGVWHLQMTRGRKIGVYMIFTVGAIAPAFSTIGFVRRLQISKNPDQTYNQTVILLWATAELATGVTLTCVPTLPSLYKRRKSKPSTRVTIGSKRSRSTQLTSTDNDPTIVEADYFELKGRDGGKRHTRMPATAFVNEITGGEGDSDHSVESLDTTRGIMRVVKIEQSKV